MRLISGIWNQKKHSNLFFIGEVLDIDGDTGGFNLQFAYSSAMAAVKNKK